VTKVHNQASDESRDLVIVGIICYRNIENCASKVKDIDAAYLRRNALTRALGIPGVEIIGTQAAKV